MLARGHDRGLLIKRELIACPERYAVKVPQVSVVMPVRNAMPFLPIAIESILAQTFSDFELVIGDDDSTDQSLACAHDYAARDPRIRILESRSRLGPVGSSNWVAKAARADLVARMDADDVCVPHRLERQVALLDAHPEAVLVGSVFNMIDARGRQIREENLHALSVQRAIPPILHPSIMYRRASFEQVGGYREGTDYCEDGDLYSRLAVLGDFLVSTDPLLSYRLSGISARLNDDRATVERGLRSLSAEGLPGENDPIAPRENPAPVVFQTFATLRLWSGQRPEILVEMARRMQLRPFRQTLPLFGWTMICTISPPFARQLARARLAWRNWRVRDVVRPGHTYRWRPNTRSVDLGKNP